MNDQLKFPLNLKRGHDSTEVAEFEGNEHVHFFHQYYFAARRAGFKVWVRRPSGTESISGPRWRYRMEVAYSLLISGDVSLNLVAKK